MGITSHIKSLNINNPSRNNLNDEKYISGHWNSNDLYEPINDSFFYIF